MLATKTPRDINQHSLDEVVDMVKSPPGFLSVKNRLEIYKIIYKVLGFDLTPDAALALLAEPPAELIISTAGGGKTTQTQLKLIGEKLFRKSKKDGTTPIKGSQILCLVYNSHNVSDIENKHADLVARLKASGVVNMHIDSTVKATTMHSFCDAWRKEYVAKLNMVNFTLVESDRAISIMETQIKICAMKTDLIPNAKLVSANSVLSLYNYWRESMVEPAQLVYTDRFSEINIPLEAVMDIFQRYEKAKENKRLYDYTDMLHRVYNLMKTDAEVLKRMQSFYEYIVADEIQDFTPIMMSILQLLQSDNTPLLCIGDDDQSLYGFRGADIYNTLNFSGKFSGGEVYVMARNHRCAKAILDTATNVICMNSMRYEKDIVCTKEGGEVNYIPYNTTSGEKFRILQSIQDLKPVEQYSTVVCFRERESSWLMSQLLAEANIPHYVISGYQAFSHPLYKIILQLLDALLFPTDRTISGQLFKVLPVKRDDFAADLELNPDTMLPAPGTERAHFGSFSYNNCKNVKGFSEAMYNLIKMSKMIKTEKMSSFFPQLYSYLMKYYWNYRRTQRGTPALDAEIEKLVSAYFNVDVTYEVFYERHSKKMDALRINQKSCSGVALSTFHGLKGLEFNNVFIMDMDDEIFPAFGRITSRYTDEKMVQSLKEAEVRLYFTALTRAKKRVDVYYAKDNPSLFVRYALDPSLYPVQKGSYDLGSVNIAEPEPQEHDIFSSNWFEEDELLADEPVQENVSVGTPSESDFVFDDEFFQTVLEETGLDTVPSMDVIQAVDGAIEQQPTLATEQTVQFDTNVSFLQHVIGNL